MKLSLDPQTIALWLCLLAAFSGCTLDGDPADSGETSSCETGQSLLYFNPRVGLKCVWSCEKDADCSSDEVCYLIPGSRSRVCANPDDLDEHDVSLEPTVVSSGDAEFVGSGPVIVTYSESGEHSIRMSASNEDRGVVSFAVFTTQRWDDVDTIPVQMSQDLNAIPLATVNISSGDELLFGKGGVVSGIELMEDSVRLEIDTELHSIDESFEPIVFKATLRGPIAVSCFAYNDGGGLVQDLERTSAFCSSFY